jgi:hypothetical protein
MAAYLSTHAPKGHYSKQKAEIQGILVIKRNGYEYILVEVFRTNGSVPCALGYKNYALRAIRKEK